MLKCIITKICRKIERALLENGSSGLNSLKGHILGLRFARNFEGNPSAKMQKWVLLTRHHLNQQISIIRGIESDISNNLIKKEITWFEKIGTVVGFSFLAIVVRSNLTITKIYLTYEYPNEKWKKCFCNSSNWLSSITINFHATMC